jgi:hypothetical protein
MIIDESFGNDGQAYQLTRVYQAEGRILRVRVHRDHYLQQSWATAQVLTPVLTWTDLAEAPASGWHPGTPTRSATGAVLAAVADWLAARASTILIRHQTGEPAPTSP